MHGDPIDCNVCGAPMTPQSDGRTYVCRYCNAQVQVAIEGHQIAAGMRLDLANADAFLAQLAAMLAAGFGAQTRVDAEGGRVVGLEVNLDPDVFLAHRESHGVVAKHRRVVRGIALRTATVPLERWVEQLTAALAKHANDNARAAQVLAELAGRGRSSR